MSDAASDLQWRGAEPPALPRPLRVQVAAAYLRLTLAVFVTAVLLVFYALFRAMERVWPAFRLREGVQRLWGRVIGRLVGLKLRRIGTPMRHGGALVCNHISWSDILTLSGSARMTFVSKDDVRGWPGVGAIAALCGTVFIARRRSAAKAQEAELRARILHGDRLVFFPEGTSTDGLRVLPFRSTLFAALLTPELRDKAWVQPVSLVYRPNPRHGLPREFYGWWADMPFGGHVWAVLTLSFGGEADVVFHPAVRAADFPDRKALAAHCEAAVRRGVTSRL